MPKVNNVVCPISAEIKVGFGLTYRQQLAALFLATIILAGSSLAQTTATAMTDETKASLQQFKEHAAQIKLRAATPP